MLTTALKVPPGNTAILPRLLSIPTVKSDRDSLGNALRKAVEFGNAEAVELLLGEGLLPEGRRKALAAAEKQGSTQIISLLKENLRVHPSSGVTTWF